MKKSFALITTCVLALFLFCGCNPAIEHTPEHDTLGNNLPVGVTDDLGKAGEKLTTEDLIAFHENGNKYPENFVFKELEGYGRVVKSSSSKEEARSVVKNHFNSGWCKTVENELKVETDLYYGLYAKWAYYSGGNFSEEPTSYYDEFVVSFKKDVYDVENEQFGTRDEKEIKRILDYIYYSETYEWYGYKVYGSEISRKGGQYVYEVYALEVCYGDWGIQDFLTFVKEVRKIDSATGKVLSFDRTIIKTASVDGDGMAYEIIE